MILLLIKLFGRRIHTDYYTIDGHKLAPHPGMTDEDLREFERHFKIGEFKP